MNNLYKLPGIIYATRGEAEDVLDKLLELLYTYKVVSVADLYELTGLTSKIMDRNYGWTDLARAMVCRAIVGYKLELPTPELLSSTYDPCPYVKAKLNLKDACENIKSNIKMLGGIKMNNNQVAITLATPITFTIPNIDTCIGNSIICPKDVMQKAYIEKIGKCIDFCGKPRIINSVKITEDIILVELT